MVKANRQLIVFIFSLSAILCWKTSAQNTGSRPENPDSLGNKYAIIRPVLLLETWASYCFTKEIEEGTNSQYDVFFRRLRFGAKGNPFEWLNYSFLFHSDRLGQNGYSSNSGRIYNIGLWNAYASVKLLRNSELLYFNFGYYWAVVSREFNNSLSAVSSLDKTHANWYLRKFISGTGSGINPGIGFGGNKNFGKFGIGYRLGIYSPEMFSTHQLSNPLITGRVMFSLGDPEQKHYKFLLSGKTWTKQQGITLGFGTSSQRTRTIDDSLYSSLSQTVGADIAINYEGFQFDGEYFLMQRKAADSPLFHGSSWHTRFTYNFLLGRQHLATSICFDQFNGRGNKLLYKYIAKENTLDMGLNWYVKKGKLKLALHYLIKQGNTTYNAGNCVALACQLFLF